MNNILLSCGCRANSTDEQGNPSCVIHTGSGIVIKPIDTPNLTNRKAKCYSCNSIRDSSLELPFFTYRGEGSPDAKNHCKNCGYYEQAHNTNRYYKGTTEVNPLLCSKFEPHGVYEYDTFYCGCRGWD
jgi:hypothetical protein